MPEYTRVRDTSGHEISVRADVPEGHPRGIQEGQKRIDKAAVDGNGLPLEPKYRTALGTPRPGSKVDRRRAQNAAAKKTAGTQDGPESAAPNKED